MVRQGAAVCSSGVSSRCQEGLRIRQTEATEGNDILSVFYFIRYFRKHAKY